MSASTSPNQFLSPLLEVLPPRSRKSNSSADGKPDYFINGDQEVVPARENSPSESPLTVSALYASIVSSAHSESESNYSNESKYLTPPQNREDNDKPPYKARSESSASLNMSTGHLSDPTRSVQRSTAKHRDSNDKPEAFVEYEREHRQVLAEQRYILQQKTPGCQRTCSMKAKSDHDSETLGSLFKGVGAPECRLRVHEESPRGYSSLSMPKTAPNIISRRWSSVRIDFNEVLSRKPAVIDNVGHRLSHYNRRRRNILTNFSDIEEIVRVVRARLTFHEVPTTCLPTPAIITLRRASGILSGSDKPPLIRAGSDLKLHETQTPLTTYLITTNDIDFVTNLIKSGFDVRKTEIDVSNRNNIVAHKPSVTARGLLPASSGAADLAITTEDIHQTSRISKVSFKNTRNLISNAAADDAMRQSQILSNRKTPEVIWEDTRLPESLYSSSKASSSSGGQTEVIEGSCGGNSSDKSAPDRAQANSPRTDTLGYRPRESSDYGDKSPTSRVFQWVFREPSEEAVEPLIPDSGNSAPAEEPISPKEPRKKSSGSSRAIFRPDVISFPPLLPRQLTTDWFSPLPNISELSSGDDKCLYDAGIDAQLGSGVRNLNESLIHAKGQSMSLGEIEYSRDSPSSELECSSRRKSMTIFHPQVSPRLGDSLKVGNALGCSSGARRKSSTKPVRLRITDEGLEHHSQEMKSSWVKPRKDSGWPAPRSPSPNESHDGKASRALVPPLAQTLGQPSRWLSKFGQMQPSFGIGSSPLLAEIDHTGIYGALTGAKSSMIVCEPDCKREPGGGKTVPEIQNPSTDWIG